ncbi:type IV pilus biogenesis protein PilM [Pseudomonas gingeri]|uniref:Type IV pilus biogenesis protein PilM n=1 Tax=Pseudomonas gingeri TaxID=117681 RepID=A0A7Y7X8C1_9PSED|nr:type IV pilus biogenesis protein PilM [Pseudomonas gingeri]NWB94866.1 type IV pilus biogenesis protein PilM [Pseudomonas gingeri]
MPLYWVILLVLGIALSSLDDLSRRSEELSIEGDSSAIAHNLLVYRNALAKYAQANTGITGPVADASLSLPAWFMHLPGVDGYIVAGNSYAFYASPPAGLVAQLAVLTDASTSVGYVSAGRLISPAAGATAIVIPPTIPDGAAVAYR